MPYFYEDGALDIQRLPGMRRFTHRPARTDPTVHTPNHPFCYDPLCACHANQKAIERVQQWVQEGLMTQDEATAYIAGRTL
jgi:hypothetical protein